MDDPMKRLADMIEITRMQYLKDVSEGHMRGFKTEPLLMILHLICGEIEKLQKRMDQSNPVF